MGGIWYDAGTIMPSSLFQTLMAACLLSAGAPIALAASAPKVGDPANPVALRDAIVAVAQAGGKRVTITPGKYVLPGGSDSASLTFRDLHDFEIDAPNVDLAIEDTGKDAVEFSHCRSVVFRGATIHYTVPHTGQGRILSVGHNATGNFYDVQLDAGYPQDADFQSSMIMDGDSPRFKAGCWDAGVKSIVPLSIPGQERLYWNGDDGSHPKWNVKAGDYITCRGPGGMMLHADACAHCTFENITLYWGGVFGYFDTGGGIANRYLHDVITYGPAPPGATHAPLLSQSADGLHCAGARVGPDIENCAFAGMPDDGIAIHGSYEQVAQSQGDALTVGSNWNGTEFQAGDPIRVQNDKTGLIADAKVTAVQLADFTPDQKSRYRPFEKGGLHYFRVTLDRPIDAPFDSLAADPAHCGAGYKIIGCTIQDNRARGMLLKADNGLVQNNTVDGSTIAGIVVSPETWWGEAGYSHNLTLIGNTVRHTCYAMTGPWSGQAAAITITGEGSLGNQNVQILNNTVEDMTAADLVVRWARDVTIRGNRFLNSHQSPSKVGDVGKDTGIDASAIIWLGDCANIALSENTVRGQGAYATQIVSVAPTALNVTGVDDGVRTASAPDR